MAAAVALSAGAAWVGWQKLAPRVGPSSQPALTVLRPDTLDVLKQAFNEARGKTRAVALLSPT